MVVNSTSIKDDRRVLAIKELSGLLKDKNYNFDKECVDNLVKRFNQNVSSGTSTYPCKNIKFKTHYVWYSFKESKFFIFAEDCYGYSYPDPKYLSLDLLMIGKLDIDRKRINKGFVELYEIKDYTLFVKDEELVEKYVQKLLITFTTKQLKDLSQKLLLENSTFYSELNEERTLVPFKEIYNLGGTSVYYIYNTPLILMTKEERESAYNLLIRKNINKLQFGRKFSFSYTEDVNYISSFQEEVDIFLENIRSVMIESFVDDGKGYNEKFSSLKITKYFIFNTYEELFLNSKVMEYSKDDSVFKIKNDIKDEYLLDQLSLFTDFLQQIGSHNFNKNRGTLLYTLMKFLSENFDESTINVLASKILDIKANNLTSEMKSIREKLKMFITEHFIDLFFGKLIKSNKEEFLNEIYIFDKESTSFSLNINRNVETFKKIKSIFHKKVGLPLKPLNYLDVMGFEFLNVNSLSSNRIDEWEICFATELGQSIKFKEKPSVSLSISGFTSILLETSDFRLSQSKRCLETFAAVTKNNFDDLDINLTEEDSDDYQKAFEFFRYGIENGALSNFRNTKYLSNFIIKMADHLKK